MSPTKTAARTIWARVDQLCEVHGPLELLLVEEHHQRLRSCGLSNAKVKTLLGVNQALQTGVVAADIHHSQDADYIVSQLVQLWGIGRWTAEMALIFFFAMPDIWSEGDASLVRGLAHEIKNPLGGIRGAAQLLARELPEESLKDYTNVIIEEADRLRNLVDRMLGSNKLPSLAMTNVHEVLERVCSLVEAESQGCITLVRDYDPSIPDVLIDREQMIQAVLNIVRNAMQAISGQNELRLGRISLRTRAMRQFTIGHVRHRLVSKIEIIDNGPGIAPELQETIFYPMVSGRPDGTGLGLAITQNIISQHQGLIECDSHPGHTTFSIFLPLEQGAAST